MIVCLVAFIIFYHLTGGGGSVIERYMDSCYTYAMKDLDPTRSVKKIPWGVKEGSTCNNLIEGVQKDYPDKHVYSSSTCPPDYYKIAPYIDPSQDYFEFHFYRKDEDGWSHKMGSEGVPTRLDAGGNVITNPSIADRDYGNLNYTIECPTLCVKK